MRKLVFQQFLSIDGFAADKNHSTEFFNKEEYGTESSADMLKEMQRFDTILLGAATYKMFVEYWPDADNKKEIIADKLNSIPKYVFSKSIKTAPWGKWEPATIVSDDAAEAIRKLKAGPGKDLVLWGSISLAKDLMHAGLIDEYQFRMVPVILGDGTYQFDKVPPTGLSLTQSIPYPSGLLFLRYETR